MMFSATFPDDVQRLAQNYLNKDYNFVTIGEIGQACEAIEQRFISVSIHKMYSFFNTI